jgi:ADP-ribose pyrophosphatase
MDLTEHLIEREQLVDGVLLKAYRDRVRLPDGEESVREWIDHPGASAVVPTLDDGRLVLVRQYRYPVGRTFIEVPAGKLDVPGEDPLAVAERELEEETGFAAGTMEPIGSLYAAIGYSNEVIHCFTASDLVPTESNTEADEFIELVFATFDEAIGMVITGEICDMKSVAALLLANAARTRA